MKFLSQSSSAAEYVRRASSLGPRSRLLGGEERVSLWIWNGLRGEEEHKLAQKNGGGEDSQEALRPPPI